MMRYLSVEEVMVAVADGRMDKPMLVESFQRWSRPDYQ